MNFTTLKEPKSTKEKIDVARKLYDEWKEIHEARDKATWFEGWALYYIEKYGLHNYLFGKTLSKSAFYREIDIPTSTAEYKIAIYEFYVVKHGFTFDELKGANTHKLYRAIPYIRDKQTPFIKPLIEYAEREKESIGDFLVLCGAPDTFCVHAHIKSIDVKEKVCEDCGKKVKKT